MADYSKEIAQLEQILNSGVKQTSVDGTSTSIDIESVRLRLEELKRLDDSTTYAVRRRVSSINLGGAW